ncbi:hypothetical protein PGH45_18315 [Legionella pneumophila]|nr:hypothetical protein [Legionella pneumophila]
MNFPEIPDCSFCFVSALRKWDIIIGMKKSSETNPSHQDKENPNNLTLEAIEELESCGGKKYSSFKSMVEDLEDEQNS